MFTCGKSIGRTKCLVRQHHAPLPLQSPLFLHLLLQGKNDNAYTEEMVQNILCDTIMEIKVASILLREGLVCSC